MYNSEQTTREKILTTALDMFSKRGYHAVSIREIGKAVGIKESSIYYHFKNKRAIFEELLQQTQQLTRALKNKFNKSLSNSTKVNRENFIIAGIVYLENYLLEEKVFKLIKMLTIEKQTNNETSDIYNKLLFVTPLEHQKEVFKLMIQQEYIKNDNPVYLAYEYQAIFLFIFEKHFSGCTAITKEVKLLAKNELTILLTRFFSRYFYKEV